MPLGLAESDCVRRRRDAARSSESRQTAVAARVPCLLLALLSAGRRVRGTGRLSWRYKSCVGAAERQQELTFLTLSEKRPPVSPDSVRLQQRPSRCRRPPGQYLPDADVEIEALALSSV